LLISDYYKEGDKVEAVLKEKNNVFGVAELKVGDYGFVQGFIFQNLENLEPENKYNFIIETLNPKEKHLVLKPLNA
jgi:hypothetical protein